MECIWQQLYIKPISKDTRHIEGKLWELKFYNHNRIFYALVDNGRIYLLHACKKQKNKAERFELETARKRMREMDKI